MKRVLLDTYLGKKVKIVLFDGTVCEGELHKTGEERFINDLNLLLPRYYFCINPQSALFKCSHVRKLEVLN